MYFKNNTLIAFLLFFLIISKSIFSMESDEKEAENLFLMAQNELLSKGCESNLIFIELYNDQITKILNDQIQDINTEISNFQKLISCLDFYQKNTFPKYQSIFLNYSKSTTAYDLYTSQNYFDKEKVELSLSIISQYLGFKNHYEALSKLELVNSSTIQIVYQSSSSISPPPKKIQFQGSIEELKRLNNFDPSSKINAKEKADLIEQFINCIQPINKATKETIKGTAIDLTLYFNPDGSVKRYTYNNNEALEISKKYEIAKRSLDTVFNNKSCQFFKLPLGKFSEWSEINIRYNF